MVVYRITNKINGKVYVGQTRHKVSKRWAEHKTYAFNEKRRRGSLISTAIFKYGLDAFVFEVIDTATSLDELDTKEIEAIEQHDCMAPKGYNLVSGGKARRGISEVTREKYRLAKLGKKRILTPEHIEAIRNSKSHRANAVLLTNIITGVITEFPSVNAAAKSLGKNGGHFHSALQGKLKTIYGHTIKYKKSRPHISKVARLSTPAKQLHGANRSTAIVMTRMLDGVEFRFDSINEAARKLHLSSGTLNEVLNGNRRHHGGYYCKHA